MHLSDLQTILDELLHAAIHAGTGDQNGVFLPSERPVARLGLALEPFDDLETWLAAEHLDALFLHRPWQLTDAQRAALDRDRIGVVAYHLAFDERLTTGLNPTLAACLGLGAPVAFGEKDGRPLGMFCDLPAPVPFAAFATQLEREFGGPLERRDSLRPSVQRIAVVGAMTDVLVRAAHAAGADAYVTGQLRQPARPAVDETGLGVVVLGHQRSEVWGLRTLADLLHAHPAAPGLEILLPEVLWKEQSVPPVPVVSESS